MRTLITLLTLALAITSSLASAQSAELKPGSKIRFDAPGVVAGRATGVLIERRGDTLRVVSQRGIPLSVRLDQLSRLEISEGKSAALGAETGALWTGGAYALVGLAIAGSISGACEGCTSPNIIATGAYFGFSGAMLGALIGAIVGRERWTRLDGGTKVSMQPMIDGAHVGVRLSFAH